MTILYLDIGNSRVKWVAVESNAKQSSMSARPHGGAVAKAVAAVVTECAPDRVVAVDVTATLPQGLPDGLPLKLFTATVEVAGLINGYDRPERLGADRWAAVIGAWQGAAILVIDTGTALTADLVDGAGRHLGGWIAPGRQLATESLTTATRGVRVDPQARDNGDRPGTDTSSAVAGGTLLATRGFVDQVVASATQVLGAKLRIVLTGGDASVVAAVVPDATVVEDLVLQGLIRWDGNSR
jgi:type III pantothenate kinase